MYKEIEKIFKEKSEFNIATRVYIWSYGIIMFIIWILGLYSSPWLAFLVALVAAIIMVVVSFNRLNLKWVNPFKKKIRETKTLQGWYEEQEYRIIKEYIITKKMYASAVIEKIIDHYRSIIPIKIKNSDFITILSVVITIVFSVIDEGGLKLDIINTALPWVFFFIIIYLSWQWISKLPKMLKGEAGMYERLEEIFTELLVELNNEKSNRINGKKVGKKKRKQ